MGEAVILKNAAANAGEFDARIFLNVADTGIHDGQAPDRDVICSDRQDIFFADSIDDGVSLANDN